MRGAVLDVADSNPWERNYQVEFARAFESRSFQRFSNRLRTWGLVTIVLMTSLIIAPL